MVIGILSAKGSQYHPNRRLIESCARLGHTAVRINPVNCLSQISRGKLWVSVRGREVRADVLLPRLGATVKDYAMAVIRQFELMAVPMVNGFHSILLARNKFMTLQTLASQGIPVPESYLVCNFRDFQKAVSVLGGYPVIAKKLNSRQGAGVILVENPLTAEFIIHNLLNEGLGLLVQKFYEPVQRTDIRAFVIGGRVTSSVQLKPRKSDFRANIHLRSRATPIALPQPLSDLAAAAAGALGLEICGVDIILDAHGRPRVIEVNYAPGFRGLESCTGDDIALAIIHYVLRAYGGS